MRFGGVALAFVMAGACSEPKSAGLRVPLPEGWAASEGAPGVLRVGPRGRAVLTLERRAARLPTVEVLRAAVEAENGVVVRAVGDPGSTGVRYTRGSSAGLLVVRTLESGKVLLCASTPEASELDFDPAETLCAQVR